MMSSPRSPTRPGAAPSTGANDVCPHPYPVRARNCKWYRAPAASWPTLADRAERAVDPGGDPGWYNVRALLLFDADVSAGADIDLCVFNGTTLIGSSGTGTSAEEVNFLSPAAGDYTVVVQGWGVVGSSRFKLHTWLLGSANAGNVTVSAPPTAVVSQTRAITITTNGLAPATKYLGSVDYGGTSMPNPTIVRIDTP